VDAGRERWAVDRYHLTVPDQSTTTKLRRLDKIWFRIGRTMENYGTTIEQHLSPAKKGCLTVILSENEIASLVNINQSH